MSTTIYYDIVITRAGPTRWYYGIDQTDFSGDSSAHRIQDGTEVYARAADAFAAAEADLDRIITTAAERAAA